MHVTTFIYNFWNVICALDHVLHGWAIYIYIYIYIYIVSDEGRLIWSISYYRLNWIVYDLSYWPAYTWVSITLPRLCLWDVNIMNAPWWLVNTCGNVIGAFLPPHEYSWEPLPEIKVRGWRHNANGFEVSLLVRYIAIVILMTLGMCGNPIWVVGSAYLPYISE